jgi:hypothetical protein
MSLLHRFRQTAAILLTHQYHKQDPLASELRDELKLGDDVDLRPVVSRFLGGEIANSGFFEAVHLVFWREIVAGDYPLHFLTWLERAYASYDLDASSSRRDRVKVRTLLAEARLLFQPVKKSDEKANDPNSRFEAARHLMLGIAVGVEQRIIGTTPERIREGLAHLRMAIIGFRALKPTENSLSNSDMFHTASAVHMADWLLSELNDEDFRKRTLEELNALGAIGAYSWLAQTTNNWVYAYNVAEIYGKIGDREAPKFLLKAIELNPRLADFELETGFDGIDEPLDEASALQNVLPEVVRTNRSWLEQRIVAYRRHADLYQQDVAKGTKAMLNEIKQAELAKKFLPKRSIAVVFLAIASMATTDLMLLAGAVAKPVF